MNDMEKKQHEALKAAWAAGPKTGVLNDEDLEGVSGGIGGIGGGPQGAVFTGTFYVAQCKLCGWRAAFDNKGEYDLETIVMDHMGKKPSCPGDFDVFKF